LPTSVKALTSSGTIEFRNFQLQYKISIYKHHPCLPTTLQQTVFCRERSWKYPYRLVETCDIP